MIQNFSGYHIIYLIIIENNLSARTYVDKDVDLCTYNKMTFEKYFLYIKVPW